MIIIAPTRELAIQIYGVATELCSKHGFTFGVVMGGNNKRSEEERLVKGESLFPDPICSMPTAIDNFPVLSAPPCLLSHFSGWYQV